MKIALAKRGESPMADFIYGLEALDFSNFDGAIYLEGVIRRGDGGIIIVLMSNPIELEFEMNEDGECVFRSKETGEALITYKCVWYFEVSFHSAIWGLEELEIRV